MEIKLCSVYSGNRHCLKMGVTSSSCSGSLIDTSAANNLILEKLFSESSESSDQKEPKAPGAGSTQHEDENVTVLVNGTTYKILKLLGTGGSSEVYRAQNLESQKLVAIKKVLLKDGRHARKFRQEVNILQRLHASPMVADLIDHQEVVSSSGKLILIEVLELGEMDLGDFLHMRKTQGKFLTDSDIKSLWRQMLRAVSSVHSAGILHLDLKPANFIMVNHQLKLIDFGLSLMASTRYGSMETLRKTTCGTWYYASPEAIGETDEDGSHLVSDKSDVWSLGCILYKMVYHKLPFHQFKCQDTKSFFELLAYQDVEFPSHVGHNDPKVKDVLRLCLQRDPTHRASVKELLMHPYINNTES